MVKLSDTFLSNVFKNKTNVKKKTHLLACEKNITEMCLLKEFTCFEVMDLRYNAINELKNIDNQHNLTHLYLQKNEIENLEGFLSLRALKVLYLDFNKIEVIENLGNCPLKTLSLKGQRLKNYQMLAFDPACMEFLKNHLENVILTSNNLKTISNLRYLRSLRKLDLSENRFSDLNAFCNELSHLNQLKELNLMNNPILKLPDAKIMIISHSRSLERLNNNEISFETRLYYENIFKNKHSVNHKVKCEDVLTLLAATKKLSEDLPLTLRPKITLELLEEIKKKKMKSRNKLF